MSADLMAVHETFLSVRDQFSRGKLGTSCHGEVEAAAIAAAISLKSPCQSKRGVTLWNHHTNQNINVGWNDQPFGFRCDGSDACKKSCGKTAIHAEEATILATERHALQGASMIHIKSVDGLPVPSGRPSCVRCSGMILESGIDWMWLLHHDGLKRYSAEEFHAETIRTLGLYAVQQYTKIDGIIAAVREPVTLRVSDAVMPADCPFD